MVIGLAKTMSLSLQGAGREALVFDNHKRRHLITRKSVKKPGSNKK
jgi:hypothetical protein